MFALVIFYIFFGLRWTLEGLIAKNYALRQLHLIPDKLYWADNVYMKLYGFNTGFYNYTTWSIYEFTK